MAHLQPSRVRGFLLALPAAILLPLGAEFLPAAPADPASAPAAQPAPVAAADSAKRPSSAESKHAGGEPEGIVQVANLVYAGLKSSECFADQFLIKAEKESAISTSRRFHAVKLNSDEIYAFPLLIMTGEGAFQLSDAERNNLRRFAERGGFLLASAGCSSPDWNRSFRREMELAFPTHSMAALAMDHPLFHTVYDINTLEARHGKCKPLEGITINGRLGVVYSEDGLNDTSHTQGCCCCGGNEVSNAIEVNVNILAYVLTH
jgi:hypothetical protein